MDEEKLRRFEAQVMPHLDAAYNLARWLTRDSRDAEDLTQMAFVRACKFFDGFRGDNARAWLLTIVRHTYYSLLRDERQRNSEVSFDELAHSQHEDVQTMSSYDGRADPEAIAARGDAKRAVTEALEQLPRPFREVIVLKEMEDLSYKEIAEVAGIPIGTVMSRLARGRKLLLTYLKQFPNGGANGL